MKTISVIGAGKMGLPLAVQMASRGARVHACDIAPHIVDAINNGVSPIDEPGVPELLEVTVEKGALTATTDTVTAVAESEAVLIIVPALLTEDRHADLSILEDVTRQVAQGINEGLLVSYETTVPVGTTRNAFLPLLQETGLVAGEDFFLAYSPERVKSRRVLERLTNTPKIVGGLNEASRRRAAEVYRTYLGTEVIDVGPLEAAEMVKLAGMIYRDVNIALVNEMARYSERLGIDVSELIAATNTDGEAHLLLPGIGVGGHCAPVYPYFMIHDARRRGIPVSLAEQARAINDAQADHTVARLESALGSLRGLRAAILGLGFRPEVKEDFCSPAFLLQRALQKRGAAVELHDSLYSAEEVRQRGFRSATLDGETAPDAIVLNTAHPEYFQLDLAALAKRGLRAVVDGRNIWEPNVVRGHDLIYIGIGRP